MHGSSGEQPSGHVASTPRLPGRSIQTYLVALLIAGVLPVVLFAAFIVVRTAELERNSTGRLLIDTAQAIALDLDRTISGYEGMLSTLAHSPSIKNADFAAFHDQAQEMARLVGGWIILADESGQEYVNTRLEYGAPLPQRAQVASVIEVFRNERTFVSDLVTSRRSGEPAVSVEIPVRKDGEVAYTLALGLPAASMLQPMRDQPLQAGWTAGLIDRKGIIIGRTRDPERAIGQPATGETASLIRRGETGWFPLVSRDGVKVYTAFARVRRAGWTAAVSVPQAVVDTPLWRSLAVTAGGGILLLLLGSAMAFVVGRRIARPLQSLAASAALVGQEKPIHVAPEKIRELATIGESLVSASNRVSARASERDAAEEALREEGRTLEALNRTNSVLAGELDLEKLVQVVTDTAVSLTGANFGAFFYNVLNDRGESYTLYTLSGVPREAFSKFPMPRNTAVFNPTFQGTGVVRSDDILKDPRYGHNAPYRGMPPGHLPVRSYLAVPVVSRAGEVVGGLFFGHRDPGVFTERAEKLVVGIATQAAIGIDNARLYQAAQREIAERTRAEEALRTLNETLEHRVEREVAERLKVEEAYRQSQKMEAIGQLTGGVAHDFNNLLQVVQSSLEAVRRRAQRPEPPDVHDLLRLAEGGLQGAQRAATLVKQLLAFSRRQPLAPRPIDVNKLVTDMSDLLRRTLGESIAIETVLGGGLWRISADQSQLETAFINLAVNARDAMPHGGKLTIESANTFLDEAYAAQHELQVGQYVMLAVSDTGAGMDADVLARAFEPFFTTKSVGQGTGLGLSQVYGFMKQSGGHVKIYSERGEGTTVKLYLPRMLITGVDVESVTEPATPPASQGETLLVVEDEVMVRLGTVAALEELGYRVLEAGEAESALQLLDAHPEIRLLFTDVGLPGPMNGRHLADEARRRRPDLKVLFTTGYARNAIIHHGRLDPGVELVAKPFTYENLAARIRHMLDAVER
jgi:signal transduction histidine kinase